MTTLEPNLQSNLAAEIKKSQLDLEKYKELLLSELRFLTREAFLNENRNNSTNQFKKYTCGTDLIEALNDILEGKSMSWNHLISLLVNFRELRAKESLWRHNFRKDQEIIEQGIFKREPSALVKKKLSEGRRLKAQKVSVPFRSLTSNERTKEYKKQVALSRINASKTMKIHLKSLQLLGLIPNPLKLPYLSTLKSAQYLAQPQQRHLIPGSVKSAVLKKAYDEDIIRTILGSELEYRLNEKHFFGKVEHVVNRRGPAKIKIIASHSGAMPVHFLRTPRKQLKFMKMVGIDVKRLMRCIRKRFIWNLNGDKSQSVSETKHGDGYSVVGSRGYSFDEIMFPREYYQKLANEEALWEYVLEKNSQRESAIPIPRDEKSNRLNQLLLEWTEALEISTVMIDQELELYFRKYRTITKELRTQRAKLQLDSNKHHEKVAARFLKLLSVFEDEDVFMHSDLYNNKILTASKYESMLANDDSFPPKLRRGVSTRESTGILLGDYLAAFGFKGFKMGQNFRKRHSIIKVDSFIE